MDVPLALTDIEIQQGSKGYKETPYGEEFPKPWPRQKFIVPLQAI